MISRRTNKQTTHGHVISHCKSTGSQGGRREIPAPLETTVTALPGGCNNRPDPRLLVVISMGAFTYNVSNEGGGVRQY